MDIEDHATLQRVHADQLTRALLGTSKSGGSRLPPPTGRGLVAGGLAAALVAAGFVVAGVIGSGGLRHHDDSPAAAGGGSAAPTASAGATASPTPTPSSTSGAPSSSAARSSSASGGSPAGVVRIAAPPGVPAVVVAAPRPATRAPAAHHATQPSDGHGQGSTSSTRPPASAPSSHHTSSGRTSAPSSPPSSQPSSRPSSAPSSASSGGGTSMHDVAVREQRRTGITHSAGFYSWVWTKASEAVQRHSQTWRSESPYTPYLSPNSHHSQQFLVDLYFYAHAGWESGHGYARYCNPYGQVLHWS